MLRLWNIWSLWRDRCDFEVPVWAESSDAALEAVHRQGLGWGWGSKPSYQGLHAQPAHMCDGCDGTTETPTAGSYDASIVIPTSPYLVTHHDGTHEPVRYCDQCAELAAMDWNGETKAIRPMEPLDAGDLSLTATLAVLGFTHRPARSERCKDILSVAALARGVSDDDAVVFTGAAWETWDWLRANHRIG